MLLLDNHRELVNEMRADKRAIESAFESDMDLFAELPELTDAEIAEINAEIDAKIEAAVDNINWNDDDGEPMPEVPTVDPRKVAAKICPKTHEIIEGTPERIAAINRYAALAAAGERCTPDPVESETE